MTIGKPATEDIPRALELARSLGLDYPEMEKDELWVAKEAGRVVGVVALRTHPDWLELCSLGVDPRYRSLGAGRALVEALMAETRGDVYLGTIIPDYFERLDFRRAASVPAAFTERHGSAWCDGCAVERCAVMVRPGS